ncbi:MAG: hypothetical protein K6G64_09985 [Eubacterium sp.]|nr:hypothetical protein [Eubacterium sp.]
MKKNIKMNGMKLTAFSIAMVMGMSMGTVQGETKKPVTETTKRLYTYTPKHKEILQVEDDRKILRSAAEILPKTYRSDQEKWAEGIRVKDQAESGLCWAFSTTTAAEYSWAKETYEQTGRVQEMSPAHLGYFLYNRVNDPLGNTAGDRNLPVSDEGWPFFGGDLLSAMQHLATYSGVALESDTPFDSLDLSGGSEAWDDSYKPFDNLYAYKNYVTLENCECMLSNVTVENLKTLIHQYGAVASGITMNVNKYMNQSEKDLEGKKYPEGRSFYNYEASKQNHAITIIGWDDDYPATNFTHEISGMTLEKSKSLTTPAGDGAWVIQNSWGTTSHEQGIFYVSYYSKDLVDDPLVTAFDMQRADTYQYNVQYDGTADCGDSSDPGNENFYTKKNSNAANVFVNTTRKPMKLEGVGFTTYNAGTTKYNISVYKNLTNSSNPASGTLAGTTTVTTTVPGAKTAVLNKAVPINVGETYSIVFSFPSDTYFGVEKERTDYEVEVQKGQSFFKKGLLYSWKDMETYDACFRIKALGNEMEDYPEETTTEQTTEEITTEQITKETTTAEEQTQETTENQEVTTQKQEVTTQKSEEIKNNSNRNEFQKKVQSAKKIRMKLISVKSQKGRKAKIQWKKVKTASGYQIRYSTNRKFRKKVSKRMVRSAKKYRKIIKGLKAKKTYYVQVRSFQKIRNTVTGKTIMIYGKWSNKKKVKIKK